MACLRCCARQISTLLNKDGLYVQLPLLQFVRGIKPRWLPKSKSKIFYVRKPTPIDPVEHEELRTAYFHYKASLKAVRSYLTQENEYKLQASTKQKAVGKKEETADNVLMEEQNHLWNARVQVVREAEQAKEAELITLRLKRHDAKFQERKLQRLQAAEEKLKKDLVEAENFVTLDNLDIEIEKLLDKRVDFNFAVDKEGRKFSDMVPEKDSKKETISEKETEIETTSPTP